MTTDRRTGPLVWTYDLPLSFRREIVEPLFEAIYFGADACQLNGVRGVGMSNLLRFVCERRVVAYQLGEMATTTTLPVYLETGPLPGTLDLYWAIVRCVSRQLQLFRWPRVDLKVVQDCAKRLGECRDEAEAETNLSDMIGCLGQEGQTRLVLIFDEFDRSLVTFPAATLRALRRLRDDHKRSLMYITGTRTPLSELAARRAMPDPQVDKFIELFRIQLGVPPYSEQDTWALIDRRTTDWRVRLDDEQRTDVYRVTGGHANLVVAALAGLHQRELPWAGVTRMLLAEPARHTQCSDIWNDLEAGEQDALVALVGEQRKAVKFADLARLRHKGLVRGRPDGIFAAIFEEFIRRRVIGQTAVDITFTFDRAAGQ